MGYMTQMLVCSLALFITGPVALAAEPVATDKGQGSQDYKTYEEDGMEVVEIFENEQAPAASQEVPGTSKAAGTAKEDAVEEVRKEPEDPFFDGLDDEDDDDAEAESLMNDADSLVAIDGSSKLSNRDLLNPFHAGLDDGDEEEEEDEDDVGLIMQQLKAQKELYKHRRASKKAIQESGSKFIQKLGGMSEEVVEQLLESRPELQSILRALMSAGEMVVSSEDEEEEDHQEDASSLQDEDNFPIFMRPPTAEKEPEDPFFDGLDDEDDDDAEEEIQIEEASYKDKDDEIPSYPKEPVVVKLMDTNRVQDTAPLPVFQLNRYNFYSNVHDNRNNHVDHWIIRFCHDWYEPCTDIDATWKEAAIQTQHGLNADDTIQARIRFADVDCSTDKPLCNDEGVDTFPKVIHYKQQVQLKSWSGGSSRDIPRFQKWIQKEAEGIANQVVRTEPTQEEIDETNAKSGVPGIGHAILSGVMLTGLLAVYLRSIVGAYSQMARNSALRGQNQSKGIPSSGLAGTSPSEGCCGISSMLPEHWVTQSSSAAMEL